jgi:hypothetical protein
MREVLETRLQDRFLKIRVPANPRMISDSLPVIGQLFIVLRPINDNGRLARSAGNYKPL